MLSASGLAVDRFTYVGFLSRRSSARQAELRRLIERGEAFVVHEAPRRVGAFLTDLAAAGPQWEVCMGREVTKVFEEFRRGSAGDLVADMSPVDGERGEFTIVVAPPAGSKGETRHTDAAFEEHVDRLLRALLSQGVTPKTLAKALSELPGISHKQAYARVLALAQRG